MAAASSIVIYTVSEYQKSYFTSVMEREREIERERERERERFSLIV